MATWHVSLSSWSPVTPYGVIKLGQIWSSHLDKKKISFAIFCFGLNLSNCYVVQHFVFRNTKNIIRGLFISGHIFFDDAMKANENGHFLLNDFVKTFMASINEAARWDTSLFLTNWGLEEMDNIYQMAFPNSFSWKKMLLFGCKFHWCLFQMVQVNALVPFRRHNLDQWWHSSMACICINKTIELTENVIHCHGFTYMK